MAARRRREEYGRGGILGLASVQAKQSGASRTSPVLRGNWVVETLLGEKLPRPPPNVPQLPEEETATTGSRCGKLVEKHVRRRRVRGVPRRIDPFGFALENIRPDRPLARARISAACRSIHSASSRTAPSSRASTACATIC